MSHMIIDCVCIAYSPFFSSILFPIFMASSLCSVFLSLYLIPSALILVIFQCTKKSLATRATHTRTFEVCRMYAVSHPIYGSFRFLISSHTTPLRYMRFQGRKCSTKQCHCILNGEMRIINMEWKFN